MYSGRKGGSVTVQPLGGGGAQKCPRSCAITNYRMNDLVLVTAKGTKKVKFRHWADTAQSSSRKRVVSIGDPGVVKAVFARRR